MLPGLGSMGGFVGRVAPPVCTFLQGAVSSLNTSSYTFSAQNLGTPAADRYIVVTYLGSGLFISTVSSITVGGVSATLIDNQENDTSVIRVGIAIAAVPTGTTGDIVITFASSESRAAYSAYRVTGLGSATPYNTNKGSSADPLAATIDVPQDGFTIGSYGMGESATCTWTNLTEAYDATIEANANHSSAMDSNMTAQISRSITVDASTGTRSALVLASWR